MPEKLSRPGPPSYFLIFNRDRSAKFDEYGFSATNLIAGNAGVMTFVVGTEQPPLLDGWTILGRTYKEVWDDPGKLAVYNALYPPDAQGNPRPFGFFSGADAAMMGR
jgi:hypothetical protein